MDFDANLSVVGDELFVEASCPHGEAHSSISLPPPETIARNRRRLAAGDVANSTIEFGNLMFELLFPGRVRTLFDRCRGDIANRTEAIRVRVRARASTDVLRLHALPWELARDADEFLALRRDIQIVRYLKLTLPVPAPLRQGDEPIEVLIAIAAPSDQARLDSAGELAAIEQSVGDGSVRLHVLRGVTRTSLAAALRETTTHVLHVIGHGEAPTPRRSGSLCLETADGLTDPVSADDFANITRSTDSLRLVVLNTCDSATIHPLSRASVAHAIGPALALRGIPAVVGMTRPIFDSHAIAFARVLYRRLAAGDSLEASAHAARLELAVMPSEERVWTIPVVFTRMREASPLVRVSPANEAPPVQTQTGSQTSIRMKVNGPIVARKDALIAGSVNPPAHRGDAAPSNTSVRLKVNGPIEADDVTIAGIVHKRDRS